MSGKNTGFTLIELMVVMAIIALLLTIALPRYFDGFQRSKESVLKQDLFVLREAIDNFYADKGKYPNSIKAMVDERYIRSVPIDPITGSGESWVVIGLPEDPTLVFDIRSGAEGEASDGTLYYDW